jgi:hypothetical protein
MALKVVKVAETTCSAIEVLEVSRAGSACMSRMDGHDQPCGETRTIIHVLAEKKKSAVISRSFTTPL